jgi:hypothetical protein
VLTHHLGWVATILPGKMSLPHFSKKPCAIQLVSAHFDVGGCIHVFLIPCSAEKETFINSAMNRFSSFIYRILKILSYGE